MSGRDSISGKDALLSFSKGFQPENQAENPKNINIH